MAGLFDAMGTATRGLQTVQRGLATVGHNIANVDTPGYSRQRSILQTGLPLSTGHGAVGSGVEQLTVERVVDQFIGTRLNAETARKASLESQASTYRQIESVVNEQLADGLQSELNHFFGALEDLSNASDPGQPVEREVLVAAGAALADTFHQYDAQLRGLQTSADLAITGVVPEINALSRQIADLNQRITVEQTIAPPNDLLDQRDQLIRDLSERIEIQTLSSEDGTISVRISGGLPLVDRNIASELVAVVDPANPHPFDPTYSKIFYGGTSSLFDVTSDIRGGELGGLLEARDNIVAGTIRDLDVVAFGLAQTFNAQHRTGFGLVDGGPHDFFADLGTLPSIDDAARNFALSADIDSAQGGTPDHIAAGGQIDSSGLRPGAALGDTDAVEALKDVRALRFTGYLPGDTPGAPTGGTTTIAGSLTSLIAEIGQNARTTSRALAQQESVLAAIQERRDSVSSVSIDEEVSDLVRLQANFRANARVISTVSSMLDDLFNAL